MGKFTNLVAEKYNVFNKAIINDLKHQITKLGSHAVKHMVEEMRNANIDMLAKAESEFDEEVFIINRNDAIEKIDSMEKSDLIEEANKDYQKRVDEIQKIHRHNLIYADFLEELNNTVTEEKSSLSKAFYTIKHAPIGMLSTFYFPVALIEAKKSFDQGEGAIDSIKKASSKAGEVFKTIYITKGRKSAMDDLYESLKKVKFADSHNEYEELANNFGIDDMSLNASEDYNSTLDESDFEESGYEAIRMMNGTVVELTDNESEEGSSSVLNLLASGSKIVNIEELSSSESDTTTLDESESESIGESVSYN